jgi:hypothetical protein
MFKKLTKKVVFVYQKLSNWKSYVSIGSRLCRGRGDIAGGDSDESWRSIDSETTFIDSDFKLVEVDLNYNAPPPAKK